MPTFVFDLDAHGHTYLYMDDRPDDTDGNWRASYKPLPNLAAALNRVIEDGWWMPNYVHADECAR